MREPKSFLKDIFDAMEAIENNGQSFLTTKPGENTIGVRYIEPEFKRLMKA